MKRKAPWQDFAGNDIHEGDIIEHPSGERARVCFWEDQPKSTEQWRAFYEAWGHHSRLCLQIGDKGQAVVIQPDPL
jgi:hypothetical protein